MMWVLGWCRGNRAFFRFQGGNLLGDDQNFKRGEEVKKGENQISRREPFFLLYQSKLLSHFIPVFPDTTLNERSLKLMTVLLS